MIETDIYDNDFFQSIQDYSLYSAREIIPLLIDLVNPKTVIDIGCGQGIWLSVFQEYGVTEILGIDGEYVDQNQLKIPAEKFISFDITQPLNLEQKFDLVVSLEVAEHLPSESAETFINSLTKLGNVVLFSAAIPFQGGNNHINEQWPDYWANIFAKKGYLPLDLIRKKVWQNENVAFWYAQNTLIYVSSDCLDNYPLLKQEYNNGNGAQLSLVHPQKYLELKDKYLAAVKAYKWYEFASNPQNMSLKEFLLAFPTVAFNGIKKTIQKALK